MTKKAKIKAGWKLKLADETAVAKPVTPGFRDILIFDNIAKMNTKETTFKVIITFLISGKKSNDYIIFLVYCMH